ncbi:MULTISPECIES: valine--tRNA ligase [unclassified Caulobacter]|uniref:valine--tRNA ligase n=1 Tax=unclassified Caulobacter TaxID=2648921 RepID=UPI000D393696|nr:MULTISPECIES: valine--tRNA ligase [unclassified Caulobacter]PTS81849.1 valine--tRNA ligase [Caulobacter sp. HMWF009]PTT04799.1 valine--tRNA ligase [Caulobacter sp. HMWF025]
MLEKTFDPKSVEPRLYAAWEASGAFQPSEDPNAEPFVIVIPPPNVTGSLHIGHALNNTLQDVLTRFHRMRGKAALWLPGTDHAGIATQMVVERQLAAAGNAGRRDMGREAFVDKVWEWKAESGGTITNQLRRLGASCDWSRERFTLDEGLSAAVRKVFVQLYKQGLLYRDKRLVNWDPQFQTAISDLEVEQKEVDGAYWHFAYPLADGVTYQFPVAFDDEGKATEFETRDYIVVATTRPETMLGDTGVAVHPTDERYSDLVGKHVVLPIVGRRIPIVADDYADPTKGSGAVKITPAHDFNDFGVGKRAGLEVINILTVEARLNESVPAEYQGMDRFAARKAIVARAEEEGWLKEIEKTKHMVPHGDRSGVVIEPFLTDQWYVDAKTLAQPALKAVENGDTVFEPRHWEKTYFEWLRNIEPWCVSRQLWWGHRIPAWFGPKLSTDGEAQYVEGQFEIFVAETEEEALADAAAFYSKLGFDKRIKVLASAQECLSDESYSAANEIGLFRDEDVLDTWFSSALWPFSTLGWPEKTSDVARFYPTSTLVTGFDIIFFWVARMMMMGLHFMGEVPFRQVFINALVRDEKGAKMSKSKGNVMDPLVLIDELGCDAVRFTMTAMSGQARDIKLSKQRIEGYRNFGTKLWNATRFAQMNECVRVEGFDPATVQQPINQWIRGETVKTVAEVTRALEAPEFDAAAGALYRFIWNVFCDWYLELAKPILNGDDAAAKAETRATAAWALDVILKLLHPVMPFITEELWDKTAEVGPARETMLISAQWPAFPDSWIDAEAQAEIGWLVDTVSEVRSVRAEMNVPPGAKPPLTLIGAGAETTARLARHRDLLLTLGRLGQIDVAEAAPAGAVPFVLGEATAALSIAEFIDLAAEKARLTKEIAGHAGEIEKTNKKLNNPDFLARAKEEVVEENRERLAEAQAAKAKLEAALSRLAAVG